MVDISSAPLLALLLFLLSQTHILPATSAGGNETDILSLLQLKSTLIDPLGALSSWNQTLHFCQWQGVTCNNETEQRVTQIDLKLNRLSGSISPHIGNLSFLTHLILNNNTISGEIPPEIGRLTRLQQLVLVQNSISGTIPPNLSACSNLTMLRVGNNGLSGEIPTQLCNLMNLQLLSIHFNNFTGNFPSCFGNVSSLQAISAARNQFVGGIPESLARLSNLNVISFGANRFSGQFPLQFFNSSSIQIISIIENQLTGALPLGLGFTLPNLVHLNVAYNNFTGRIPESISNATNLQVLELGYNNFHGGVPSLAKLNRIQLLGLISNNLGSGGEGDDLFFLHTLTNSTMLQVVNVGMNNFSGVLPHSISNYSATFVRLSLRLTPMITGTIPAGLDRLVNLEQLDFNGNSLSGNLPVELGRIPKFMTLQVQNNNLSGTIPSNIGNSTKLLTVWLQGNQLEGEIPSSFGQSKDMTLLNLADNNLSGGIPPEILDLQELSFVLDLSGNRLSGRIPEEVGNLVNLGQLDLSNNMLSGSIPSSIGGCVRLETINLTGNLFQGSIPSSFRALRGLEVLDLSRNNLSGTLPDFLQEFTSLVTLNLSYNNFQGALSMQGVFGNSTTTLVMGNNELCGGMPEFGLPKCSVESSKKGGLSTVVKIIISVVSCLLGLAALLSFLYFWFLRKKTKDPEAASLFTGNTLLGPTYNNLLHATDGFSSANLLGAGSYGSVYKGIIAIEDNNKMFVAVKVLNLQHSRAVKSFVAECEVLKNIRHRNLVKLLTVCSGIDFQGNDFKALVYDFMVNGSLEEWLHPRLPDEQATGKTKVELSLLQRLNIAIDVGTALDYLHNESGVPVVHCDLKPSNILLDVNMVGHIGDFGLAKFLPQVELNTPANSMTSSSIGVRGTVGYSAPEYGMGSEVSTHGDVYSYGILLLEMFTGRRPTDEAFKDGLNLHNFSAAALADKATEIVDPTVLLERQDDSSSSRSSDDHSKNETQKVSTEAVVSIIQVGVECSNEMPRERMSISDALSGSISPHVGNLSFLTHLVLNNNTISGEIPPEIGRLRRLQDLVLAQNSISGTIPANLSACSNLTMLRVGYNGLTGEIPIELCNLMNLQLLSIHFNNLTGEIPPSFGKCQDLSALSLGENELSGEIPVEILNLPALGLVFNLSWNRLSGRIPDEVGNLVNLGELDLSNNMLSGSIPSNLGKCVRLETLNLMGNLLQGPVPSSLRELKGLEILDLSRNNLSVMGNNELCGGMPEFGLPKCSVESSRKGGLSTIVKIIISVVSCLLGLIALLSFLYFRFLRKKTKDPEAASPFTGNTLLGTTYHNLLQATDEFSSANLLGAGSYGSVYKGLIAIDDNNKMFVAVKVLNLQHARAFKSFVAECEVLKNIRHRNLVKLLTVCSGIDFQGNDFKALVYEFMVNGSLEEWLHPGLLEEHETGRREELSVLQRLNIAIDVGTALDYLHNDSGVPVVHCDLKPSNILLDVNMVGHICDFGLAKFLPQVALSSPATSSSVGVRGTVGYSAPGKKAFASFRFFLILYLFTTCLIWNYGNLQSTGWGVMYRPVEMCTATVFCCWRCS
ncbi:unnamed protein product [Linum tenue]|uniref:non-specific serine/threonine protein kinase n=1 Tax=Linum tenue TaxID=586396 RepID=A0AAV0K1X2_9ROSI|nr:unnamed protein product [Linum tenue]